MIVVPYKAQHLLDLQVQMAQAYSTTYITPEYAKALETDFSFTALHDGEPIAVGGVAKVWGHRAIAWALLGEKAKEHFVSIHKAAAQALSLAPYARIEADTPVEFKQGHRWLKMLGFNLEAERMKGHRVDGGDSALYAKVMPWRS